MKKGARIFLTSEISELINNLETNIGLSHKYFKNEGK